MNYIKVLSLILSLLTFSCMAKMKEINDDVKVRELVVNMEETKNIDSSLLEDAITKGLWSKSKSSLAFCVKDERSVCIVVIKKKSEYKAVDVTLVEIGNLGKLGYKSSNYEKYETVATKWFERKDGLFQVKFTTYAWKAGQRYTASESLIISQDGEPLFR